MSCYEPPLSVLGSPLGAVMDQLAPGVRGYAVEHDGKIYIPVIAAEHEGNGDVGRFLDSLSSRCVIPNVLSRRLRDILTRHGWQEIFETTEDGETVDVWVRKPMVGMP